MTSIFRIPACLAFLLLLPFAFASAQDGFENQPPQYGDAPKHSEDVKKQYEANLKKYKGNEDVLVLPGLVANRKTKRVELAAEATGLAENDIIEFLLIAKNSEKGYESLVWSHAKPSDVHKALEFIGLKAGEAFNPNKLRFWPKGERVMLSVPAGDGAKDDEFVPIETLVMDPESEETLPPVGFLFVGSTMLRSLDGKPEKVYGADFYEPKSVASAFNDMIAVLDVPRRARKNDVYGRQVVSSEYNFNRNELLTIVMEPANKDGRSRVRDLTLEIRRTEPQPGSTMIPVEFLLRDEKGKPLNDKTELQAVLAGFGKLVQAGDMPYVSVVFDKRLRLAEVQKLCRVLALLNTDKGIRVEPPAEGQLYYEAFLPERKWLNRKARMLELFELAVKSDDDGKLSGTLTLNEEIWTSGQSEPSWKVTTSKVDSPQKLRDLLDADAKRRREADMRPGPPILVVFAEPELEYGKLVEFLGPAMTTHNTIHVFTQAPPPPEK